MSFHNYQSFWNDKASSVQGAMLAVDGSADEATLRATGQYSARQAIAALELQPDDHVLELGCGVGRIGREIAQRCALWHGVDIAPNMVEVARQRLADLGEDRVRLNALSRTRLDGCADASFDKAYCVAVFIHMDKEDFLLYLRELYRVLKPGGRLYFDHWNLAHPVGFERFEMEVAQYVDFDHSQRKDVARNQFTCPEEVRLFLQHAGFDTALVLDDAPFLQAIALKPGGEDAGEDAATVGRRLAAETDTIAYSPEWTRWFERVLAMLCGREHPQQILADMPPRDTDKDAAIYHPWIRSLWRLNSERWGPCPD